MGGLWQIFRRNVMPVSPEPESFYAIADPLDAGLADLFISGNPGNVRKVKGNQVSGWGAYAHTGASQDLVTNAKVTLENNAGTVLHVQKPVDVATFYNGAAIPGRNGDGVAIGIELTFTPSSGQSSAIVVSIDIGGAVGELYSQEYAILKGGGVAHKIAYTATAYMLDTWQANGGTVKVVCDGPGAITAVRYVIQRLHKAIT
jgi:hypothetical protein